MCGIAGIFDANGRLSPADLAATAERMAEVLTHRGPDGGGVWSDPAGMIGLGHRRLAILDLTPAGGQPMVSSSGRYVLCANSEIYNWPELRTAVEAARAAAGRREVPWRSRSDTEILLEACETFGTVGALKRAAGMFALALWDRREKTLTLARDRLGEKPLYYAAAGGRLLFASELPGILRAPGASFRVDRSALALYLRLSCIPAPHTILSGVRKLPAGQILTISAADLGHGRLPAPQAYWRLKEVADAGLSLPFTGTDAEAEEELLRLLRQSVRGQMAADVPVGALLSGGIDSSLVAALMAEAHPDGPGAVRTFTIAFADSAYDESGQASAVARHLGTRHATLTCTPKDALEIVPQLWRITGEPLADASLLPLRLVAELTRREVKVCLSGDGGDEMFAGYNRHIHGPALWNRLSGLSAGVRSTAAGALSGFSPRFWDRLFAALRPLLPPSARTRLPGEKLHKLAAALSARVPTGFYEALVSAWPDPGVVVAGTAEAPWILQQPGFWPDPVVCPEGSTAWMQFLDASWFLAECVLAKVDRASMSVGLESRAPYLDHRVAQFAWRLPLHLRVADGRGKIILRRLLGRYVPERLWDRPKTGFGAPLDAWLRGPLKDWAEGLLDPDRLARSGLLQPEPVRRAWKEHLSGRFNRQYRLWPVLMLQSWLENTGISG